MRGWLLAPPLTGAATAAGAQTAVERGRYLVEAIAGCGNCHTPTGATGPDRARPLVGGLVIVDDATVRAVAPVGFAYYAGMTPEALAARPQSSTPSSSSTLRTMRRSQRSRSLRLSG